MTTSIVERLRWMSDDSIGGEASDLIEQQAKEIAELKRLLAEEQEISSDGLLIAHLNGAASARDRIRELEALAKKMADALEKVGRTGNCRYIEGALHSYRELIKE